MIKDYKLSLREKVLIGLLAVILIVFCASYFLFMPALNNHSQALAEFESAQNMRMNILSQITSVNKLRTDNENMKAQLNVERLKYTPYIHEEELESEFTRFLIKNGSDPKSVLLSVDNTPSEESDELIKFSINIKSDGYIDNLLRLADYTNGIYSYRTKEIRIYNSGNATTAEYVVEAVLTP